MGPTGSEFCPWWSNCTARLYEPSFNFNELLWRVKSTAGTGDTHGFNEGPIAAGSNCSTTTPCTIQLRMNLIDTEFDSCTYGELDVAIGVTTP